MQKPAISRDGRLPSSKKSNALLALLVTYNVTSGKFNSNALLGYS